MTWDPSTVSLEVRLRANPGKRGLTTGKTRTSGTRLLVQVQFGPNEKSYKPYHLLELCGDLEGIPALFENNRFSPPDELRRMLTFEKVKGYLTNIYYSMESSKTNFYAHQFKPVLKFLESPTGRLLIADEVGLGKTIESMYVWKELVSREDARRLLIVCPAILREKWQDDLRNYFNIKADLINSHQLLEKTKDVLELDKQLPFACIVSMEGLRPSKNWDDTSVNTSTAQLARILDSNSATDDFGLFDLAIIDEAHYMRNPSTATHQLGKLIRDSAKHLILLTATPIQVHSRNLYQLLRIVSPEDFFNESVFDDMLEANRPLVGALRHIWSTPPNLDLAQKLMAQALNSKYFSDNPILKNIYRKISNVETIDTDELVRIGYKLESSSLIGQYISRSRKRDVIANRVERSSQTLKVQFTALEQAIYGRVTDAMRQRAKGQKGTSLFSLITRQRQMASCMPAALTSWSQQGILEDLAHQESIQMWEDLGIASKLSENNASKQSALKDWTFKLDSKSISELKQNDSKYRELIAFISKELRRNSSEKFVLFSYFKATLTYLQERLATDGILSHVIMGGMGEDKWETIHAFREDDTPILLSSEVGSEGIDLQFCRFLINYDLPWNPMRVEQRIGRLDRLGQQAERISIVNFSQADTIEERILERLYDRIDIFRESIGDLEMILGEMTQKLLVPLLDPNLTDIEREKKADEATTVLLKQREAQEKLEREAVNMVAFSDHILTEILKSREQGRWLHPQEMYYFIDDFFARYYPGTTIEPIDASNYLFTLSLSEDAKVDLEDYRQQNSIRTPTLLTKFPVSCGFDPKAFETLQKLSKVGELIEPSHPLVQWIGNTYTDSSKTFHPAISSRLDSAQAGVSPGLYVYTIHRWEFTGLKSERRLAYKAIQCNSGEMLPDNISESFVNVVSLQGQDRPNAANLIEDMDSVLSFYADCDDYLEESFDQYSEDFETENTNRCNVQQRSAEDYANRKIKELEERIEKYRSLNNQRMIPATQGLLNKINRELELKIRNINRRRDISLDMERLSAGIVLVE
ncbi:MAG: SNF2-related protein [Synechococcus sp.]